MLLHFSPLLGRQYPSQCQGLPVSWLQLRLTSQWLAIVWLIAVSIPISMLVRVYFAIRNCVAHKGILFANDFEILGWDSSVKKCFKLFEAIYRQGNILLGSTPYSTSSHVSLNLLIFFFLWRPFAVCIIDRCPVGSWSLWLLLTIATLTVHSILVPQISALSRVIRQLLTLSLALRLSQRLLIVLCF